MKLFGRGSHQSNQIGRRNNVAKNQKVISYYTASRKQLDSFDRQTNYPSETALRARRLHSIRQSWFVIIVGLILLLLLGYIVSLNATPYITIKGQSYRSNEAYRQVVSSAFGHNLSNNVKFLIQVSKLEKTILNALPEAQTVTVDTNLLGHHPDVKIITASAMAVFEQTNGTNLIMSNLGKLLLPVKDTNLNVSHLPILHNQTGISGKVGQQFITPDEAKAFSELVAEYQLANDNPNAMTFSLSNQPYELDVNETGRGYSVKYLLSNDILQQYGALQATKKTLQSINQQPTQYIDVRLVEKVYYK